MFHLPPHLLSLTHQLRYLITNTKLFKQSRFSGSSSVLKSPSNVPVLLHLPPQLSSKPGFFRQNSERRSFKLLELRKTGRDTGISSPSRISPPSTPSSPDDTPCLSGDPYNRRRRKIPKVWNLRGLWQSSHCSVCDLWSSVPLREVRSWSTHAAVWGWVRQRKIFWWIFPVRSVPRGRPPRRCIEMIFVGAWQILFIGLRS